MAAEIVGSLLDAIGRRQGAQIGGDQIHRRAAAFQHVRLGDAGAERRCVLLNTAISASTMSESSVITTSTSTSEKAISDCRCSIAD